MENFMKWVRIIYNEYLIRQLHWLFYKGINPRTASMPNFETKKEVTFLNSWKHKVTGGKMDQASRMDKEINVYRVHLIEKLYF